MGETHGLGMPRQKVPVCDFLWPDFSRHLLYTMRQFLERMLCEDSEPIPSYGFASSVRPAAW